jgi:hypothetical protein
MLRLFSRNKRAVAAASAAMFIATAFGQGGCTVTIDGDTLGELFGQFDEGFGGSFSFFGGPCGDGDCSGINIGDPFGSGGAPPGPPCDGLYDSSGDDTCDQGGEEGEEA